MRISSGAAPAAMAGYPAQAVARPTSRPAPHDGLPGAGTPARDPEEEGHAGVSEWADQHRKLSSRASAEPEQYRTARTPFCAKSWMRCRRGIRRSASVLTAREKYRDRHAKEQGGDATVDRGIAKTVINQPEYLLQRSVHGSEVAMQVLQWLRHLPHRGTRSGTRREAAQLHCPHPAPPRRLATPSQQAPVLIRPDKSC